MKEEIVCSDSEPEVKLNFDSFDKNSIQDIKSVSSISNLISSENLSASKKSCEKEFY